MNLIFIFEVADKIGDFAAFKLAEIAVSVGSSGTPLGGVVVSVSGGAKNFRQNSLTSPEGGLSFHSLLPGDYFVR